MTFGSICKNILDFFLPSNGITLENNTFDLSFFSGNKFLEVKQEVNNHYNIHIDLDKATPEQIKKITEFYPQIRDEDALILQENNYTDLKKYLEELKNVPILKYFKGKINDQDYNALRTSVFIQNKFNLGDDVSLYLEQLYREFGVRGRNICNLYGEGYFESFIQPFYVLLEADSRKDEFLKQFDQFVMEQPITYFVSQHRTKEQISQDLFGKIEKNKKYGIKKLNIHGIGESNIKKIKSFIKEIETRTDLKIPSSIEKDGRISLCLEII